MHVLDSPEDDVLQVEGIFDDTCGGNPDSQNVLLSGDVRCVWNPIQITQEAVTG